MAIQWVKLKRKQFLAYIIYTFLTFIVGGILYYSSWSAPFIVIEIQFNSEYDEVQLFHRNFKGYNERQSQRKQLLSTEDFQKVNLNLPNLWMKGFRLDPTRLSDTVRLRSIILTSENLLDSISALRIPDYYEIVNDSSIIMDDDGNLVIIADTNRDVQLIAKENLVKKFCVLDQARWNFNLRNLLFF